MTDLSQKDPAYVPPDYKLGPAMAALNERQRRFVAACLSTGRGNNMLHAKMAGYEGNEETLRVTGHRLAHDSRILAAMKEEGERRLQSAAIVATSILVEIAENSLDKKSQLKAIDMILNRIGMHSVTESKTTVTHTMDDAAMIERIEHLCGKLGVDAVKLLGHVGVKKQEPIEAEYREVPTGAEGLEDLLP